MKKWVVRFASLLVFNVVVLLVIGWFTPARVGWSALWAGVILTALVIWVKPLIHSAFRSLAARSAHQRTRIGEKLVQGALVFLVALLVWVVTVLFSGVSVGGWFWGYLLPPIALVIGWAVYDAIDDRVEARAGALYDRATRSRSRSTATDAGAPASALPASDAPGARPERHERHDGLTDEQRRMFDELGKN